MMEVFHLVKKAGITRDLIVGKTHEAKRSNSERFTYYDTNIGADMFCPVVFKKKKSVFICPVISEKQTYMSTATYLYWIETRTMSRSRSFPGPDIYKEDH